MIAVGGAGSSGLPALRKGSGSSAPPTRSSTRMDSPFVPAQVAFRQDGVAHLVFSAARTRDEEPASASPAI